MQVARFSAAQQLYAKTYAKCLQNKIEALYAQLDDMYAMGDDSAEMVISIAIDERVVDDLVKQWERRRAGPTPSAAPSNPGPTNSKSVVRYNTRATLCFPFS
ncbi:MAG: hypothetical protein ACXWNK_18150 [Vulcanimicrobiaceae bacterium]